jgi:uncharacterized protein DUF3606
MDLRNRAADRLRIDVSQDYECRYWSEKFGVTPGELRSAVSRVGPMVSDVARALGQADKDREIFALVHVHSTPDVAEQLLECVIVTCRDLVWRSHCGADTEAHRHGRIGRIGSEPNPAGQRAGFSFCSCEKVSGRRGLHGNREASSLPTAWPLRNAPSHV